MKKLLPTLILLILITLLLTACFETEPEEDIIRIHIRANSNLPEDQSVKLTVRDGLIAFLTPLLADAKSTKDAEKIITTHLDQIMSLSKDILAEGGFSYGANAYITTEDFPVRKYGELVFAAGEYRALILELGDATGDNWWCVAFPPLCFVSSEEESVVYKSKLLEIFESWRNKK